MCVCVKQRFRSVVSCHQSTHSPACCKEAHPIKKKASTTHPAQQRKGTSSRSCRAPKTQKPKKKKRIAPKTVRSPGAFCRQRQPTVHGRDRESPSKDNEDEHRPEHGPCDRSEQEGLAVRGEVQDKQESGSQLRFPPWLPLPIYRINCPL